MISRMWQSQEIKTVFTKGTKAALHSQWQETALVDQEALEKCRFPADSGTLMLSWRCIPKNQSCVEIKALWIHSIHFHMEKPFQRKHRKFPLEGWDRIPSTDQQSLVGVKLWRKKSSLKYYFFYHI